METDKVHEIRERLTQLNTKAYYLVVALSFLYREKPAFSFKLALTLTAIVGVLPVQDLLKSSRALEIVRVCKVILLLVALISTIYWVWWAAFPPAAM